MENHNECPDEETPLLQARSRTPLPRGQISLVFLAWVAEPISSSYISPFINQLISELGVTRGDNRKIGYYTGLISFFYTTRALTTCPWSQLSDFIGRRPIILLGLLSLSVSNFAFGLSRTLATLIISRCIAGIFNGNSGVMKSILGDITDHTNMVQAFSIIPAVFSIGATIAPLYGGALVKPQERWPGVFRSEFWATYPYFLPSLVSGCFTLAIFLVCAIFLKESLPPRTGANHPSERHTAENPSADPCTNNDRPIPMSTLLRTYSVMIPISNYGTLALVEIGFFTLLPLFYSSPIEIGGLGFPPSVIGAYLAVFGVVNGAAQALFTARLIAWLGPKRLLSFAVLCFYPLILIFPIMTAIATVQQRVGPVIWMLLTLQFIFMVLMDLSYSVIFIFTTRAAPNKQSLGATNGLSQSLASIARAVGPASTSSLFAVSKEYNILGGNLVYVILAILTTILVFLSRRLPDLKDKE